MDEHFRTFYERLKIRKGHAKAIVATAKEIQVEYGTCSLEENCTYI